jgi:aldehyde dehydrogenase (NAD+)
LLEKIITQSLDNDAFGVVSSRAPLEFLAQCVIVDQKPGRKNTFPAQRVLVSPAHRSIAVVDRTGDTRMAAQEIVASRLMFGGASSYAVDLVLVNEFVEDKFREELGQALVNIALTEPLLHDQTERNRRTDLVGEGRDPLRESQVKNGEATFIRGDSSQGILKVLNRQVFPLAPPHHYLSISELWALMAHVSIGAARSCPANWLARV